MISNLFLMITGSLTLVYIAMLLFFRQGLFNLKSPSIHNQPFVSIIVPAHNEGKDFPRLLKALANQSYPKNKLEIILVDDRSIDNTLDLMKQFAEIHDHVRIIKLEECQNNTAPKKRAIQAAIKESKGEIILTTDGDSQPGPQWVQTMMSYYSDKTVMILGYAPYSTNPPHDSLFHKMLALDYFAMGAVAAASIGMGYPSTSNGANFSYRKSTFEKADGFGVTTKWMSGDDDLLLHRFYQKSLGQIEFAFHPDAAVFNLPPANFKQFFFQRVRFSSKHLAYPVKMIGVLSIIYLTHATLAALLFSVFFSYHLAIGFLTILSMKSLAEYLFLLPAQKQLEKRNLLKYFPITVIPYLFYVTLFPILGQILKPRWSATS